MVDGLEKQKTLIVKNSDEPEATNIPEEKRQPTTFKVKKTIKKGTGNDTQIQPSLIGIQLLYELLEDAKNKQKLSTEDASKYTALYTEYRKGNAEIKKVKKAGMREIYKRVLYKK